MNPNTEKQKATAGSRYFAVWRWHFYAGLFVVPFLMFLAATGLMMVLSANIEGREGERMQVRPQAAVRPLSVQAEAARRAVHPDRASVVQYIAPRAADKVAVFRVDAEGKAMMVLVNPYTAKVLKIFPRHGNIYHLMDELHSDLMMGKVGDYLLETAASLTILMVLTGLYLWWAKHKSLRRMLLPLFGKGRSWWRNIHGALGIWVSVLLLLFCVSGIAWAGIWGGKAVQAWSRFPAGKWGVEPIPRSDVVTHGQLLNDGKTKEVPWVLELTPMPVSGLVKGSDGIKAGEPLTLETLDRYARETGFEGRYQLNFPKGETGVWTLSQDSMSYDHPSPTIDRTVHIDRYSGKVLADIRYGNYNWFGKFMAVSIALHMGTMGWWSVAANVAFCLAVIFICIAGFVMWWKRRPADSVGLVPPAHKTGVQVWWGMAVPLLLVAVVFPTAIIAILTMLLLDWLLVSRFEGLRKRLK